jgi:predicted HTH transcriptional regulator
MFNQRHFRESLHNIRVSAVSLDEIADTVVALANTNGGSLTYPNLDSHTVITALADQCFPAIHIDISSRTDKIFVSVPRSTQIHATPDRRVLVRLKAENVQLNGKQIRHLAQIRSVGDYEGEIVPGTSLNDLDAGLIERFCNQFEIDHFPTSNNDILTQIGVVDDSQRPTVAGVLLFTQSPQQWLPQASIIIKRFAGKVSTKDVKLIQEQNVQGNLLTMLDTLHHWIHGNVTGTIDHIAFPSVYPASVVFEALSNALIHREYRLRERTEIRIYDDVLQIISPGELPSFIDVDNLEAHCFFRNPNIAYVLSVWGYGQNIGTGIEQMKADAASNNQIALQFMASRKHVALSILKEDTRLIENDQSTQSTSLNWRQERAIRYIQECGSLTYHEYHALCPNIEKQILFSDLVDLVDKKLVVKASTKNVFFYLQ